MKSILFFLILIFFNAYSQKYTTTPMSYKAVYKFKLKTDSTSNKYDSCTLSLYTSGKQSILQDFYKEKFDSVVANPNPQYYIDGSSFSKQSLQVVILKDFEKQELIYSEVIGVNADNLGYTEKLPLFNWEIGNEKKKILGYSCIKATVKHRKRNYIAWFTNEIPFQDGPYKFSGLPGLIVEIYDDKSNFIFTLQSFVKAKKDILYDTKITFTKREKILQAKLDNYYNSDVTYYIPNQNIYRNLKDSRREKIVFNPIELE